MGTASEYPIAQTAISCPQCGAPARGEVQWCQLCFSSLRQPPAAVPNPGITNLKGMSPTTASPASSSEVSPGAKLTREQAQALADDLIASHIANAPQARGLLARSVRSKSEARLWILKVAALITLASILGWAVLGALLT